MDIVLASNNQGKLREIKDILDPLDIQVRTARELGFTEEIEETGASFRENARLKAWTVAQALDLPALADDSGLEVAALDNRPGVYSARYAGPDATDADNNRKLLGEMAGVPMEKRAAAFVCVMACCRPDGETLYASGRLEGRITLAPAGDQGFGYDPVFELSERGLTVAQIPLSEKNAISHRSRALKELAAVLPDFLG